MEKSQYQRSNLSKINKLKKYYDKTATQLNGILGESSQVNISSPQVSVASPRPLDNQDLDLDYQDGIENGTGIHMYVKRCNWINKRANERTHGRTDE